MKKIFLLIIACFAYVYAGCGAAVPSCAVFMDGNEVYPIRNVRIHDFHVGEAPHAHYLKITEGVRFTSSSVNGTPLPEQPEESPERVTLEVY